MEIEDIKRRRKEKGRDFKIHAADCNVDEERGIKNMGMEYSLDERSTR